MANSTPSSRELEALKVLWEKQEATVQDICDAMRDDGNRLAYTTVLSLLQVMEQKGMVTHRRAGKAYVYTAVLEQQSTISGLANSFIDRVFDGAVDEYLLHALDGRKLKPEDFDRLEQLIAQAKRKRKGKQ